MQIEELRSVLAQVRTRIDAVRKPGGPRMSEADTKAKLINPVLRAIGWDVEEWEQVRFEFKVKRMDRPVDYALLLRGTPRLLIEAKAIGEDIGDDKWAAQIMSYAGLVGAPWIALANGDDWRIYRAGVDLPLDEKLFRSVRLADGTAAAEEVLALLAREALQGSIIDEMWEEERIDRQVGRAVKEMFDPEGDLPVVGQIRKRADGVTAGQVRASLRRARISIDFPRAVRSSAPQPPEKKPKRERPRSAPGVTVQHLIAAGVIKPPLDLRCTYRGKEVRARIEADGRVRFGDSLYDSPSSAGSAARETVAGKPRGKWKTWPTNGWIFWRYADGHGELRPLDELRQRLKDK